MRHDFNGEQVKSPEAIAALISRFRASGLGLKRFAQEHGIPATRLHYWVYQKKNRSPVPNHPPVSPSPLFQEVKIPAWPPQSWAAEISLPAGAAIRFSAAALPAWIGSVVEALQRPC